MLDDMDKLSRLSNKFFEGKIFLNKVEYIAYFYKARQEIKFSSFPSFELHQDFRFSVELLLELT